MAEKPEQLGYAEAHPQWSAKTAIEAQQPRGFMSRLTFGWLETSLWTVVAIVAIGVAGGLAFGVGGWGVGLPALIFIVLMFPFANAAAQGIRRRRASAVLGYLEQAVRLNQPLGPILGAAALSESGPLSDRLINLRHALDGALPLAPALAQTVPEMPDRAIGLIQYAQRVGRLPQTLDQLVRGEMTESRNARPDRSFARWYLPTLIFIAGGIISVCTIFVFPKFKDILHDFGIKPPAYMLWIDSAGDYLGLLAVGVGLVIVIMCGLQLQTVFQRRGRNSINSLVIDEILWSMPVSHGLQIDRSLTDICRAVADALSIGQPLDVALHEAAEQLEMNRHMQRRVRRWAEGANAGGLPEDAARKAKMPAFLVGMLSTAKSLPDQSDVFIFLSRYYGSRFRRRQALLEGAIVPAVAIVMGLVVVAIALALFLPMINIIDKLCGLYGKY